VTNEHKIVEEISTKEHYLAVELMLQFLPEGRPPVEAHAATVGFMFGVEQFCISTSRYTSRAMPTEKDDTPTCHICGKPCPPEDCVTDSQGRPVHKKCYREALIEGQESL
jgi:hypothetical protein